MATALDSKFGMNLLSGEPGLTSLPTGDTSASADDVEIKETEELVLGERMEIEWEDESRQLHKIPRPTDLAISFVSNEREHGPMAAMDLSTETSPDEAASVSIAKAAAASTLRPVGRLSESARYRSASCVVSSSLLSPVTDESDRGSSGNLASDLEDWSLHAPPPYLKGRADSDPTEIAALKTKSVRTRLKMKVGLKRSKQRHSPTTQGTVREDTLLSAKMVGDGSSPKEGEYKSLKFKGRKKFTKMVQRLSEKQVLSPSYRQKNEDFHKFFKNLPLTERLLVDYACALVKDILVQGRLYVSQNYLCFHSNILKWQTAVTVNLVDIEQMTKEKTVKVIPNAIQVLLKDRSKLTFTSFTARDKAFQIVSKLWQNALRDKPMSANELWSQIHRNYGDELGGCSSDDDYVRPSSMQRKHTAEGEFDAIHKVKKKKKLKMQTLVPSNIDFVKEEKAGSKSSKSSRHSSQDSPSQGPPGTGSTDDDKSSRDYEDDASHAEEAIHLNNELPGMEETQTGTTVKADCSSVGQDEKSDDEPAEFLMEDCAKVSLHRTYDTSARDMFRIIFGDDCSFWKDTLVEKGTTDINFGTWQNDVRSQGQKIRELSYTLRLDNPIGPKTSFVKETQIFYSCSVEGKSYAADCTAQNFGIPYADYFQTCMRYCIRKVSKNSCELRITSELRYRKTPWGLVKNFLEKNVASGLSDNFRKLEYQLLERIEYEKSLSQMDAAKSGKNGKVRRRKRGGDLQKLNFSNGLVKGDGDNGSLSSDLNNNKDRNSPGVLIGAPSPYPRNGFLPNQHFNGYESGSSERRYFAKGGKFILCAIFFVFILLIYNNYCMYQRLVTLEHAAAVAATADGVDPSVTAALLDRPGVPIASSPEILSTYLQAIDKRLKRLENTVLKYTKDSGVKWDKMEKNWAAFQNMIETLLRRQEAGGG